MPIEVAEKIEVDKDFFLKAIKKQQDFEKEARGALRILDEDLRSLEAQMGAFIAGNKHAKNSS